MSKRAMKSPEEKGAGAHFLLGDGGSDRAGLLLGNEAIVRGALEAGINFAAGYPGTPSSEVTDTFARISKIAEIEFEYSVNEKVSLEVAFAASLAGARSLCAMKHLGLVYAGDPLSTIPYIGVVGGLVIVSAGDPSCHTSPNEQDQRHLANMLHLPLLDPSTPAEARAMTRFAFDLSEQSHLPVFMRITTRVCHSRGVVPYGAIRPQAKPVFNRDRQRMVPIPVNARRLRRQIKDRLAIAEQLYAATDFNRVEGQGSLAILASGAPAATSSDVLHNLGLENRVRLITVGAVHPLPESFLLKALAGVRRLLVVEELSPYLEDALNGLAQRHRLEVDIFGKHTGHLPLEFEYEPEIIQRGIHEVFSLGRAPVESVQPPVLPARPPILCAGCPHRATYFAVRNAFGPDQLYFNDIGCYTLGYGPPLNTADALLCMGASITMAAGVSRVTGQRTVGFIGDSTFFHSGMPALLNAVKENADLVLVVLDNQVTAMTGFQESPTVHASDRGPAFERTVSIEGVARALGVAQVETVDPYNLPSTIEAMVRARDAHGVAVVIAQRPCATFALKETGELGSTFIHGEQSSKSSPPANLTYVVDHELCQTCGRQGAGLHCGQCVTEGYQRTMARCRSLEPGPRDGIVREREGADGVRPSVAPCSARCSIALCVQGYIGHIAAGEYAQAYEMIVSRNPLPETVCRVCHHPCEDVCLRSQLDEPIAINGLKRFVMDRAANEGRVLAEQSKPGEDNGLAVAVIGAGPAGLAAAWGLRQRGYRVTLYDMENRPGGLLRSGIPSFRLPREVVDRDIQRILDLGVIFRGGSRLGRDISLQVLLDEGYEAVFVAVGATTGAELGLAPVEQGPVVMDALSYLHRANLVSLDQADGRPQKIIVVGGGYAALDAARVARRSGAEVTIVYRRRHAEMMAIEDDVQAALVEGITLLTQLQPLRLESGQRPGLWCIATAPGEADDTGRHQPVPVKGSEAFLDADQIIVAIGQHADARLPCPDDLALLRDRDGTLRINPETCQTSHPRIFAGGDMIEGEQTVIAALACGQRAAWGIHRHLGGDDSDERLSPPPPVQSLEVPPGPWLERVDRGASRHRPKELFPSIRLSSHQEVVGTMTEQQARAEAARCLACGLCAHCRSCIDLFGCPAFFLEDQGKVQIDQSLCTGCGVCSDLCPNGAIRQRPLS